MIRFGVLILILLISFTVSLPNCSISYWVNSKSVTCSGSPNGTHHALNYTGNCTVSPDSSKASAYRLSIDPKTKIVHNFTVYSNNACHPGYEMLVTKTPLLLNTCGPLLFMTTSSSSVRIGSLIFSCTS